MSGRRIVIAFIAASLLIIFLHELRGGRFTADRLKRIHELEAREAQLYEQLAHKDAQLMLRGQSEASSKILSAPSTSRD